MISDKGKLKHQKANENNPQPLPQSDSQPRIISMDSSSCSFITLNSNNTSSNRLIKSDNKKRRKMITIMTVMTNCIVMVTKAIMITIIQVPLLLLFIIV